MSILSIKTVEAQKWGRPSDLKSVHEYMGSGIGFRCIGYKLSRYATEADKRLFDYLLQKEQANK